MNLTKSNMTLGRVYVDDVTGFKGKLTGVGSFIDGTDSALLQPSVGADNKIPEPVWFDVKRLSFSDS